jgi:hypothetical protein
MSFWKKKKPDMNPRAKRYRGDPIWMITCVEIMRAVNATMIAIIIIALALLAAVQINPVQP